MTDGYWTHCADHIIRYINVKSLCCIPEINIILYANYTLMKFKKKEGRALATNSPLISHPAIILQ